MNKKETISDIDSEDEHTNNINLEDLIDNEPMYHVLAEFFETSDNKNITTVLDDICKELKLIRLALTSNATQNQASSSKESS